MGFDLRLRVLGLGYVRAYLDFGPYVEDTSHKVR